MGRTIFVFGSNLAGRHGKGAALYAATHYGAVRGVGSGITGSAYAIPTKDRSLRVLPIGEIKRYIDTFIEYARLHNDDVFLITAIGCGLAGYLPAEISPLFRDVPENCFVSPRFIPRPSAPD